MIRLNKLAIPCIILLFFMGFRGELLWAFILVFLHECTHYFVARHYGFSGFDVEIMPVGMALKLKTLDEAEAKEDLIISLSGPLMNIIAGIISLILYNHRPSPALLFLYSGNFALGIFNLIPALPLDGGRILRAMLLKKYMYKTANRLVLNISTVIGTILMFFYFFLFQKGTYNLNLGLIALFILITVSSERERIVYLIMGDIIKKKLRFNQRGYIENKSVSIFYKKDLITAMSLVEKNRYTMFTVLDTEMKVIDIIYEEELIEGLKEEGNVTLEEFVQIREKNI